MSQRFRFTLLTLATVLAVVITLLLGRWQLGRAHERQAQQAAIELQASKPNLGNKALAEPGDGAHLLHRTAQLRGTWQGAHTVFLDNRQMQGKPGFYVLTPLLLEGGKNSVVVQRGWVPRNFADRQALPQVETPVGSVEAQGRLAGSPPRLLELGGVAENSGVTHGPQSGVIRQNLNLQAFATETGLRLLPITLLQAGAASDGLQRDWPQVASGASKNYGYAFQWFALSALVAGLYLWFQFGKAYVAQRRS